VDEFSAIAEDLTLWERNDPIHFVECHDDNAPTVVPADRIIAELRHLSVLICVMASAANDLERRTPDVALAHMLKDFCPQKTSGLLKTTEQIAGDSTDGHAANCLSEFNARLQFAQLLTRHLSRKISVRSELKLGDMEILADAWRRVCSALLSLGEVLQTLNSAAVHADWQENVRVLLKSCTNGASPCLDEAGDLQVPGWAERRRTARVAMDCVAQATMEGQLTNVSVINASEIGLGLAGHAENGQHTTIVFPDGRAISGTVKWSDAGRFGVQLDTPLTKTDRLLARN